MTVRQKTESELVRRFYLRAECSVCGSSSTWPAGPGYQLEMRREERRKWVAAHRVPGHRKTDGIL